VNFMKKVFQSYGKYYDVIYADKDYEKECDFLEEIFKNYSRFMPKTILDAGCGTGGHAVPLAKRGYAVTGIDASEVMTRIAEEKARENGVSVNFYVGDLRKLRLNRKFDACVCMFAVMDYLTENEEIGEVLSKIRGHLEDGGLFVFDFWYGPAVLTLLPSVRVKTTEKGGVRVIRFAEPHLDILNHICEVDYRLIVSEERRIIEEVKERHRVRFFFPQEIRHYLKESGFNLLKLCSFLELDADPSERVWNAAAISQVV